jgi:two-component system response regulator
MGVTMGKGIILVADDDADDVFFLSLALEHSGLDCLLVTVGDGEEAITYLSKEQLPDVLLVDLKMPKMNGFEVLQWIRGSPKCRKLPVVVWSNSTLDADSERAKQLGVTDFVAKTADRDKLITLLGTLHSRFVTVCKA